MVITTLLILYHHPVLEKKDVVLHPEVVLYAKRNPGVLNPVEGVTNVGVVDVVEVVVEEDVENLVNNACL